MAARHGDRGGVERGLAMRWRIRPAQVEMSPSSCPVLYKINKSSGGKAKQDGQERGRGRRHRKAGAGRLLGKPRRSTAAWGQAAPPPANT